MVRRSEADVPTSAAHSSGHAAGRTVEDGSHAVDADADARTAHSHRGANTRNRHEYSGQGDVVKNAILFVGGFITVVLSLYLFSTYPDSWVLFLAGILVYGLALMVPTLFLNGSTAKHSTGGTELTLDLPRDASEMAQRTGPVGQRQDRVTS